MNRLKHAIKRSAIDSIKKTEQDTVIRRYCFTNNFIGFSGHFPGYPILPALVQLITALSLVEEHKGRSLRLGSIENAKFHMEIKPGQEVLVECRDYQLNEKQGYKIKFMVNGKIATSFSITLYESEDEDR